MYSGVQSRASRQSEIEIKNKAAVPPCRRLARPRARRARHGTRDTAAPRMSDIFHISPPPLCSAFLARTGSDARRVPPSALLLYPAQSARRPPRSHRRTANPFQRPQRSRLFVMDPVRQCPLELPLPSCPSSCLFLHECRRRLFSRDADDCARRGVRIFKLAPSVPRTARARSAAPPSDLFRRDAQTVPAPSEGENRSSFAPYFHSLF